ncbi:MAG: hypothetical protein ACXV4D_07575 [Ilumatobacteraceae bacterium]
MKSTITKRLALSLAITALLGSTVVGSANADPKQLTAAVGVGSDTTQDVLNALSGNVSNINYVPVQSSVASGQRQIISFDAIPPAGVTGTCITPKPGAPTFDRPNGSTAGRKALSRAIDGTKYGNTVAPVLCGGLTDTSGLIQFARSSAGPAAGDTGTALTYVPFGRDALSFAYYRASGGAAVTTLTRAQLTTLFTTGPTVIGGVNIIPCGIQLGSGTYNFWQTVTTATAAQEATATTLCNGLVANTLGGRAEENSGDALKQRGDLVAAGSEVVIGCSAGSFIAKSNLVAPGLPPAGVGMGLISDNGAGTNLGSPIQGTAPNLTPTTSFYSDATFGRNIYNVFDTSVITSLFGNDDLKSLFVGSTSAVCSAVSTIQTFGFLSLGANCGTTTTKGSLIAGQF